MSEEATPIPQHLGSEFSLWLWWTSERQGGRFDLGPHGMVDVWVDDRLAFRRPADTRVTAVVTGENPAHALEARAALAGGKVLQDLRIGIKRDEREFTVTLKGPELDMAQAKLPQIMSESDDMVIPDRMHAYDELATLVGALVSAFAKVRTSPQWKAEVVPGVRTWLVGDED